MSHRIVDAGIPIHCTDLGEGPRVLLMHGNPDSRRSWTPVIDALRADHRVIAPDFPGFGDSPEPPPDFDFLPGAQAELWERFAQGVGLDEPVVLVVHDFGGPWLLGWALTHPERIRALVFTNTLFHQGYRWHPWARVWQTPLVGELSAVLSPRALFRREMRRGDPALPQAHADACHAAMVPSARRTVLRTYRAYRDPQQAFAGWAERLPRLARQVPGYVFWGELDPYIPARWAGAFGVPEERIVRVPDAGHWACISRPQAFVALVRRAVRESGLTAR